MIKLIFYGKLKDLTGYGYGDGYGSGSGYGDGSVSGSGYGDGFGYGSGYGSGDEENFLQCGAEIIKAKAPK